MDKKDIHALRATIWIGKGGCNPGILAEITHQLEKRGIVKIRWLKNTQIDSYEIASETGADLIHVRGRTMILAKKR